MKTKKAIKIKKVFKGMGVGNKSLMVKILVLIGLPVVISFVLVAGILQYLVGNTVSDLTNRELQAKSQTAALDVNSYFAKCAQMVKSLALTGQMEQMCIRVGAGNKIFLDPDFNGIKATLEKAEEMDAENLMSVWIADFDANQILQSTGYGLEDGYVVQERAWYTVLQGAAGEVIMTDPTEDYVTGTQIVSIVAPIFQKDYSGIQKMIGAIGADFSLDKISELMGTYTLGEHGYYVLTTSNGHMLYHPDADRIGTNIADSDFSNELKNAIISKQEGSVTYTKGGEKGYGYVAQVGTSGWTIATGLPEREFLQEYTKIISTLITVFIVAGLILVAMIALVTSGIVSPLRKLTKAANQIADGNLDVHLDIRSKDETRQVADAIGRTVTRLSHYIDYIQEITQVLGTMAQGNLRINLEQDYAGEFAPVKEALLNISSTLSATLSHIHMSAEQVEVGASQISSSAQALATGASQQSSSIQQLSASIYEVSGMATHNMDNVIKATEYVGEAGKGLVAGNRHMEELQASMKEINQASGQIRKIIKAIDDIAFQTNILALNAAVEAARAGAAGKGFAVVADEVRNLAAKSAEAAKQTEDLIHASIQAVETGTKITKVTADALQDVDRNSQQVQSIIVQIQKDSERQADSLKEVTQGIEQIATVVQTNAATAEESSASSEELTAQAVLLRDEVGKFQLAGVKEQDSEVPVQELQWDSAESNMSLQPDDRF
ncbi:methyl-accepting chemotaxis protein [Oscillospiraceae bacterium MB08-C2-2]|nr:methyl-accepting chemotaxis protein [Oscillospiraceae bacterium MB08-C2-2]